MDGFLVPMLVLAGLLVLLLLYLVVVVFTPIIREPEQPLPAPPASHAPQAAALPADVLRRDVRFGENGQERSGWLYLPKNARAPLPCIVMNNGLGATRDMVLPRYATRYAAVGFAVLTYDYRHFGDSAGEPRNHYSYDAQIEDCRAAIAFARSDKSIDPDRIGLWGTSAAGGNGIVIAAEDLRIRCFAAQCPTLDHGADGKLALAREGLGWFVHLLVHAQRDMGRRRLGLSPHRLPIVGRPGTMALLTAPGALEGYARLAGPGFVNKICARTMLTRHGRTAEQVIDRVKCPGLFQICDHDAVASAPGATNQANRMGELAEIEHYPIGHFDIYEGAPFERAVAMQIAFFKEHLQ